ncbi:MAG: rRNA maturation RNase YbeY [Fimbriimonadaceae bacterium]|nr:rRNA maturation RNase YbeY [Fimbriimonadaceae bacterium]QYK56196.1 MAG: rRNA maturation RNase YbeY [Fimbriimonadaceae bacterium]
MPSPKITVRNETARRLRQSTLRGALATLCERHRVPNATIDVLLTDDEGIRALNRDHRGLDESTDVLSWPGPGAPGTPLGDIAISLDFAERGARERGWPVHVELAHLAVHGGLHLLGYDDETDTGRGEMVSLMNETLAACGLPTDPHWHSAPH